MTYTEYQNKAAFLRGVLKDACERGDYHLEMDTIELIRELEETYQGDTE